jgi:hypothetical protein
VEPRLDLVGDVGIALSADLRQPGFKAAQGILVLGGVGEQVGAPPLVVEAADA